MVIVKVSRVAVFLKGIKLINVKWSIMYLPGLKQVFDLGSQNCHLYYLLDFICINTNMIYIHTHTLEIGIK